VHGSSKCFRKFLNAAKFYKADVLILGGDITGKVMTPIVESGGRFSCSYQGAELTMTSREEVEVFRKKAAESGTYTHLMGPGEFKELEADLNLTRTGRGLGTPHFMAPEQFRNAKNADLRCDIYALGATLYQTVTGELPFRSSGPLDAWMKKMHNDLQPPRQIVPSLSERIDWAIRRAMSADPEQRPTSCREFVEDLTGRSTRKLPTANDSAPSSTDIWYLVYKDDEGTTHTVKGSVVAIRRSLKDGLLGDASNVRASRTKTGPFENLRSYPEFRDMVVAPAPLAVPRSSASPSPSPEASTVAHNLPPLTPRSGPASSRQSTPPPVPPPILGQEPADEEAMPHIDLDSGAAAEGQGIEWLKWLLLLLIAVATAVIAFFLLPT